MVHSFPTRRSSDLLFASVFEPLTHWREAEATGWPADSVSSAAGRHGPAAPPYPPSSGHPASSARICRRTSISIDAPWFVSTPRWWWSAVTGCPVLRRLRRNTRTRFVRVWGTRSRTGQPGAALPRRHIERRLCSSASRAATCPLAPNRPLSAICAVSSGFLNRFKDQVRLNP